MMDCSLRFHPSPLLQGSMRSHSAWLGCEMMTTHSCASPIYRTYIHKSFGNSHPSRSKTLRAYVQLLQQSTWHTYGNQPPHRKPLVGVPFPPNNSGHIACLLQTYRTKTDQPQLMACEVVSYA